jgi:protein-S-isoprenylcysteine O-methyltransferase Ste14/Flp pilus assembly pilin Flp
MAASRRADLGRLVVPPLAFGLAALGAASLLRGSSPGHTAVPVPLHWLTVLLTCGFYCLVGWCYLRRGPAVATSRSWAAHAVAVVATVTPFGFAALPAGQPSLARSLVASLLLAGGTAWAVWALRSLGASLAILAQARAVVQRGPYRFVRHPLYVGELVSCLGLAIGRGTLAAAALWLALCAMQVFRATQEESVLSRSLPDYAAYRARTGALVPALARLRAETGATALEYCLMVSLIAAVIVGAVTAFGTAVSGLFTTMPFP